MARDPLWLESVCRRAHPRQLASRDKSAIRHSSGKIPSLHPCTAAVNRSEFGSRSLKAVLEPSARPERTSDERLPVPRARRLIRRCDNYDGRRSLARTMQAPREKATLSSCRTSSLLDAKRVRRPAYRVISAARRWATNAINDGLGAVRVDAAGCRSIGEPPQGGSKNRRTCAFTPPGVVAPIPHSPIPIS